MTLERLGNQKPLERLRQIPKPSQLDDWRFYVKLEAEKIKQKDGDAVYMKWALTRETEKKERDYWRRAQEFGATVLEVASLNGRRSSVMLEVPGRRGSKIKDPKEEPTPKSGSEDGD